MNQAYYQLLKQSPLFQLSLASRELFHSNFLAWLFSRYPRWVGPILGAEAGSQDWELSPKGSKREERSLDLVLHLTDGSTLIVENKVKSVPYREQLERYDRMVKESPESYPNPRFLLLTLAAGDAESPSSWPVLTYGTVGERLLRAATQLEPSYERSLVEDYARFIGALSACGEIHADDRWMVTSPELGELRISDLLQKRKATWLSRQLTMALDGHPGIRLIEAGKKAADLDVGDLLIYDGLTNGNGLVGFVLAVADGPKLAGARALPRFGIGVQIQGNQYRSFIELLRPTQPSKETLDEYWTLCLKLFDASPLPDWWPPKDRGSSRKDLCTYGGKFLYRYRALPPTTAGADATLASLALNLLESARAVVGGAEAVRQAMGAH